MAGAEANGPLYRCAACDRTSEARVGHAAGVDFARMPDGWVDFVFRRRRVHICSGDCLNKWNAKYGRNRDGQTNG
jgi:hypothetical protein